MKTNITPVACFNGPATQLVVDDGHVQLNVGANFQYVLLNASDVVVYGPARSALTPEQYDAWTGDDAHVVASVAANIGVTPA
jgi:hypothetical protein